MSIDALSTSTGEDLAVHFEQLTSTADDTTIDSVSSNLLQLVHQEAIPASVFQIWLPIAFRHCSRVLPVALRDSISRAVRRQGICVLARSLARQEDWKRACEAVGGAKGLKEVIDALPVDDIPFFVARVLRSARKAGPVSRSAPLPASPVIDELVSLLLLPILPGEPKDATTGTTTPPEEDGSARESSGTIARKLLPLLGVCSASFLERLLLPKSPLSSLFGRDQSLKWLAYFHTDIARRIVAGHFQVDPDVRLRVCEDFMHYLLVSEQPYEAAHLPQNLAHISAPPGVAFSFDLLYSLENQPDESWNFNGKQGLFSQYVAEAIIIAMNRHTSFELIIALLDQSLSLYQSSKDPNPLKYFEHRLPRFLVMFWAVSSFGESRVNKRNIVVHPSEIYRLRHDPSWPKPEHRETLEAILVHFIRRFPESLSQKRHFWHRFSACLAKLFEEISPPAKFPLMKLFCNNLLAVDVDLETSPPSERELSLLTWDFEFLRKFPAADARLLYDRSRDRRLKESMEHDYDDIRRALLVESFLKVKWEAEEAMGENGYPVAREFIERLKKQAVNERDPDHRWTYTRDAIRAVMDSTSLDLFENVIRWSERFHRDPVVGPRILRQVVSFGGLLSCVDIPQCRRPPSIVNLRASVNRANSNIDYIYQRMIRSSDEPALHPNPHNMFSFISSVIAHRINGVKNFSRLHVGTETELTEILLESLLPRLVEYESVFQRTRWAKSEWTIIHNPHFMLLDLQKIPCRPPRSVLTFLDKLAKARDQLWTEIRAKTGTPSFRDALPKGLPVQCLQPSEKWATWAMADEEAAPFTTERFRSILFCDSDSALAEIPGEQEGVVWIVDSLAYLIKCSVANYTSKKKKFDFIMSIWRHYSESISLSPVQLAGFKDMFIRFLRRLELSAAIGAINPPQLPSIKAIFGSRRGVDEFIKWDLRAADDGHTSRASFSNSEKADNVTVLHYRLKATAVARCSRPTMQDFDSSYDGDWKIWKPELIVNKLSSQDREALLLFALLLMDTYTDREEKLLSKPFPRGSSQPRYPRLSLDEAFVSDLKADPYTTGDAALEMIRRLAGIAPATLLHDLASALLDRISRNGTEPEDQALVKYAFRLVAAICVTDQPGRAVDLVIRAVQDFPGASSFHRHLGFLRLGRALPPSAADIYMEKIAAFILESPDAQRQRREGREQDSTVLSGTVGQVTPSKEQVFIKITTVKMLAEILAEADFVSSAKTLRILHSLFYASHSVDTRKAVISALLKIIRRTSGSEEGYRMLASLSMAAAVPNERVIVSEEEWLAAEQGGPLPEVDVHRPLLELFVDEARDALPERFHEAYVRDALLPLLEESTRQHNRWIKAFLGRLELTPEEKSVTDFGPFNRFRDHLADSIWARWTKYLPRSYLYLTHRRWALSYFDYRLLGNISNKLASRNPNWEMTNAGEHWSSFFDSHSSIHFQAFTSLSRPFFDPEDFQTSTVPDGVTIDHVEKEYRERAAIVLRHPYTFRHARVSLQLLMDALYNLAPWSHHVKEIDCDKKRIRIIPRLQRLLGDIIADCDTLRRTEPAQEKQQPRIFPSHLQLSTFLLPYPHVQFDSSKDDNSRYDKFSSAVISLIKAYTDPTVNPSLLIEGEYLKSALDRLEEEDIIPCAICLGNAPADEHELPIGLLRVGLARHLLGRLRLDDRLCALKENEELRGMVGIWKESLSETVRRVGWGLD